MLSSLVVEAKIIRTETKQNLPHIKHFKDRLTFSLIFSFRVSLVLQLILEKPLRLRLN